MCGLTECCICQQCLNTLYDINVGTQVGFPLSVHTRVNKHAYRSVCRCACVHACVQSDKLEHFVIVSAVCNLCSIGNMWKIFMGHNSHV